MIDSGLSLTNRFVDLTEHVYYTTINIYDWLFSWITSRHAQQPGMEKVSEGSYGTVRPRAYHKLASLYQFERLLFSSIYCKPQHNLR